MTPGYLVDTNVISELAKPSPEPAVRQWAQEADQDSLYISVITVGELRKGIVLHPDPVRRSRLERWTREVLANWFAGRILEVTDQVAERWGELSALSQQIGHPLPVLDLLLAATAAEHGLTVATRNLAHFQGIGISVLSPWTT